MNTSSTNAPGNPRPGGRGYFWAGLGLCVLGLALGVAQYSLKHLIVPWYIPILTTLGAGLLLYSVAWRRSVVRVLTLGLVVALAGLQWYLLGVLARLPAYEGPAQAGRVIPAFRTTLANGQSFTDEDLRKGTPSVLVFFRGRW
jgi:hypothetical protein